MSKVDSDDKYFASEINIKPAGRRERKFPCCCMNWETDTWKGFGAIFSGMMMQAALGVASIWGNIVIYETSKLRGHDPQLSL